MESKAAASLIIIFLLFGRIKLLSFARWRSFEHHEIASPMEMSRKLV